MPRFSVIATQQKKVSVWTPFLIVLQGFTTPQLQPKA